MKIKKPYQPSQNRTGPKTPQGKECASRNATTHGCRAKRHFIPPSESQDEYNALEASYFYENLPLGPMDERFILRVPELAWVLQDIMTKEKVFTADTTTATSSD